MINHDWLKPLTPFFTYSTYFSKYFLKTSNTVIGVRKIKMKKIDKNSGEEGRKQKTIM